MAIVKIAYTLWQVLTGNISALDCLKKTGLAVLGFLLTPFRWVIAGVAPESAQAESPGLLDSVDIRNARPRK